MNGCNRFYKWCWSSSKLKYSVKKKFALRLQKQPTIVQIQHDVPPHIHTPTITPSIPTAPWNKSRLDIHNQVEHDPIKGVDDGWRQWESCVMRHFFSFLMIPTTFPTRVASLYSWTAGSNFPRHQGHVSDVFRRVEWIQFRRANLSANPLSKHWGHLKLYKDCKKVFSSLHYEQNCCGTIFIFCSFKKVEREREGSGREKR